MSGKENSYQKIKRKKRVKYNALSKPQKQLVRKMIDSEFNEKLELKHKDTYMGYTVSTAFNQTLDLTPITQAVADTSRIGDVIDLVSVQGRFVLTAADSTNIMRIMVIQWNEDSSVSAPTLLSVLQHTTGSFPEDILSPYLLDKDHKYKVLWDKSYNLNLTGDLKQILVEFYLNRGFRKKVQFTEASTTGVGKIYMLYISDSTGPSHPAINGFCRLRYYDA